VLGTAGIIAIILGLILLLIELFPRHHRIRDTSVHLGHLEGKINGGQIGIGEMGSERSYGVRATGKGTRIDEVDKVKVLSEGQPATGVSAEDEAQIGKIGGVEVERKKRGFWSRLLRMH
jgi:hypothetical protein